eukprot:11157952-Lingulodinium_polyedra.AAC.1
MAFLHYLLPLSGYDLRFGGALAGSLVHPQAPRPIWARQNAARPVQDVRREPGAGPAGALPPVDGR